MMYSTPSESFIKAYRDYGMKKLENIWNIIGFSEAFTIYILMKINEEEANALIALELEEMPIATVGGFLGRNPIATVGIFVDEKPNLYKHTKESDLKNW